MKDLRDLKNSPTNENAHRLELLNSEPCLPQRTTQPIPCSRGCFTCPPAAAAARAPSLALRLEMKDLRNLEDSPTNENAHRLELLNSEPCLLNAPHNSSPVREGFSPAPQQPQPRARTSPRERIVIELMTSDRKLKPSSEGSKGRNYGT